jgi:hypothetical protein
VTRGGDVNHLCRTMQRPAGEQHAPTSDLEDTQCLEKQPTASWWQA